VTSGPSLSLTAADRERIEHIDRLVALGAPAVDELIGSLSERSWTVRRAAVAALAALGDDSTRALCAWLVEQRTTEHGIAAAVDALSISIGASTTAEVIALARQSSGAVLEDLARILGRRRASEGVEVLRTLLADPNDNIAVSAIEALGAIGGSSSIEALIAVMESKNFFRTFPAMQVAARTGDPRVIEPLAALLGDETYRFEAARALGRTGSPLAIGPLGRLLDAPDAANVRLLAAALDELWTRAAWSGAIEHVLATMRQRFSGAPGSFLLALQGGELADRLAAVRILGAIGAATTLDVIAPLLADPELRVAATEAIQRLVRTDDAALFHAFASPDPETRAAALPVVSSVRSAAAVRRLLADDDAEVRARACDALARIGDTASVKELFAALGDPSPRVAHAAAAAIQSLGSSETPALAIHALQAGDSPVRRQALRIIAYLGHDAAYAAVRAAVDDRDLRISELAVRAIASLSDPRVDDVLGEIARSRSETQRAAVMRAAGHRTGDRMYALLEAGTEDDAAWVRYYACQGLGRMGRVSAAPRLVGRLADATAHVRVAAIEALARLDTPQSWQLLMSLARSRDPDEQRAALVGVGQHVSPAALALLVEAAASSDPPTRLIALSALARSSDPAASQQLRLAANDVEPDVRDAALSLLAERDDAEAARILLETALASPPEHPVHVALSRPGAARIAEISARLTTAPDVDLPVLTSALARMQAPDATHALFEALVSASPPVRRAAASALVAIGATGAVAAVRKLAEEDPDPEVRRACAAAVAG
jgi:HEAT repeat protein